jgi:uncharacterized repeat protein (TIGR02543 family)
VNNDLKSRVSKFLIAILSFSFFQIFISDSSQAAGGISLYISPPFVQGPPSSYNASMETYTTLSVPSTNAFGWTFAGSAAFATGEWGSSTSTSDTPTVGGTLTRYITPTGAGGFNVTFPDSVKYVGFYWPAGNPGNTVEFFTNSSDTTPVATFTSGDVATAIGDLTSPYPGTDSLTAINGGKYLKNYYFYHPSYFATTTPTSAPTGVINNERHAFVNILASGTYSFKKITFTGTGFESDNLSITTGEQTADPRFVFIKSILGKSVNFNSNSGSGEMTPQVSDATANISANQFTRAGYIFSGWNTSAGGGGTAYSNNASYAFSADLTLYAQWSPLTYSVTYYDSNTASAAGADGGNAPVMQSGSGLASVVLNSNTLSLSNYTFAGWATSNGSTTVAFNDSATVSIDTNTALSLYPVWTGVNFTITSSSDVNGSISTSGTTNVSTGGNQSYTFSPVSGYRISDVLVDGISQGAITSYTFSNVTANHTIRVSFVQIPVVQQNPTPTYVPQKSAEQIAAEAAAQKLADEKAAEQLAVQQKALADNAEADKVFKTLQEQLTILLNTGVLPKSPTTKSSTSSTNTSKTSPATKTEAKQSEVSVPDGTVLITPNQIATLDIAKSGSGGSANIAISQLKSGQRVRVTVISKADLNTKVVDLNSTEITTITPGPIKPSPAINPTLINIKPAPKTSSAAPNKAEISVSGAKKNQRVRVTVKSK